MRTSDERLAKWESELKDDMHMGTPATKAEAGRIYDLIADLRDSRAQLAKAERALRKIADMEEASDVAVLYFDAKARETKREGAK